MLFLGLRVRVKRIRDLGFWIFTGYFGLRNNGDLWGKVFFLGFRLGILGIWFYGDLGLRFLAWDFGNMVLRGFGLEISG